MTCVSSGARSRAALELEHGEEALRRAAVRDVRSAGLVRFAYGALMLADSIDTPGSLNPYDLDGTVQRYVAEISDERAVALAAASPTVDRWQVKGVSRHSPAPENARARLRHLARKVIVAEWRRAERAWEPLDDSD